jgi:hypothetical protein
MQAMPRAWAPVRAGDLEAGMVPTPGIEPGTY